MKFMKVTYLFGAGASADAIPVVNKIPEELYQFERAITKVTTFRNAELHEMRQKLIGEIQWLLRESSSHLSIDTFAKKLFLRNDNENLLKLKLITSLFFTYLQITKPVDKRYDGFFASILKSTVRNLPNTINIISWNYDLQFELSYREFNQSINLAEAQKVLSINSNHLNHHLKQDGFSITKLNGSSAFLVENVPDFLLPNSGTEPLIPLIEKYGAYSSGSKSFKPTLSFAWEEEKPNSSDSIFNVAMRASKDSEVLIIIGYSFPYFNREIDSMILRGMPKLKKVYFQSREAEVIKARFLTLRENIDSLELWPDVGQFLIPKELSI